MSYFTFFPNTQYTIGNNSPVIVRDIMSRARILPEMRALVGTYVEYTISDGERPEHIAHRVYGRADYHWMILLFNEIHDPYFGWPLSTGEMEKHIEKTYSGKALFVNTGGVTELGKSAIYNETVGLPHDRRNPHFESGTQIYQINSAKQVVAESTVASWDPNLWKIVTSSTQTGFFRLQDEAGEISAETGQLEIISDSLSLQKDIRCINSQGYTISASLLRLVEDNRYAIHHFEDENEVEISPWYIPSGSASPLIERYVVGRQESIATSEGIYSIVTNTQYEDRKNEAKRKIRVLKPNYTDAVIRQLSSLME